MADMPGLSNLRVPEQKNEKSWFDVRPKKVRAWLEQLPLGDSEETTKQIFAALSHTNRVKLAAATRLKVLEQLDDSYRHCLQSLKTNYLGQSFPLGTRALKYVDRTIAMQSELATAYKIAAIDLYKRNRFYQKKYLATAIYRSLSSLNDLLLTYYQIYAPEPPNLWNEIHSLFRAAEQRGISRLSLKKTVTGSKACSIEKRYKQLVMLALSNPYHLGKKEVERVHYFLGEWVDSIRILNPENIGQGEAHFVICLNQDRPPVQLSLIKTLENHVCRFIDTSDLIQHLRYLVSQEPANEQIPVNGTITAQDIRMFKQLLSSWDTRDKRSFSRSPFSSSIDISIGLNGTHFLIDEANKPPEPEPETPAEENKAEDSELLIDDTRNPLDFSHTTFSIEPIAGEAEGESHWDKGHNPTVANLTTMNNANEESVIPTPSYSCNPWKTLNIGAGGYCLIWDHDKSSNAQIGEIVGIRETVGGNETNWRIGVVRWMQYLRNQGLKLGIQILSPNATSLQSKLMNGRASKKKEYSCLSLPAMQAMKQDASLITPPMHYKVGDALILNDHGKMINVQLTRLLETTTNYSRFQYAPLDKREQPEKLQQLDEQADEWKRLW